MQITHVPQPNIIPICRKNYRLEADYEYQWKEDGAIFRLIIPKGFTSDGASVPRALWTLTGLRPDGLIRAASWLHDFLYRYRGECPHGSYQVLYRDGTWVRCQKTFTKKEADCLFLDVMLKSRISKRQAFMAYYAVKVFGWYSWLKNNKPGGSK